MSEFTAADELVLREKMAVNASGLASLSGIKVNPASLLLNDASDFWATFDQSVNTKDEIDQNLIAALWIYPIDFIPADDTDSPIIDFPYEHYLFVQYGVGRADEAEDATLFNSQRLAQEDKFYAAWLELMSLYRGRANIDGLPDGKYAVMKSSSMQTNGEIERFANCDFVRGIVGFSVRMRETVKFQLVAC